MKRIINLFIVLAMLTSSFVLPASASGAKDIGGFDFYSITFHFTEPTVIGYDMVEFEVTENGKTRKEIKYVFSDPVKKYSVYVTENTANQVFSYQGESEIRTNRYTVSNFFAVSSDGLGIGKTELAYSKYPSPATYITQIRDNTAILLKDSRNICGVADLYDESGTVNPNLVVKNGYFVDADTGNKIDDNGFIVDDNNLWHENTGVRVESFIENAEGKLIWIPYKDRVVDGKALSNSEVNGAYLVEKGILPAYPEFDDSFDYNEDGQVGSKRAQLADKKAWNEKKSSYESAFIQLYRIKTDTDNNGKYSKTELAAADDLNRTFTEADIETFANAYGVKSFVRGTPVIGTPERKSAIKAITIEIDALGTKLYSDVTTDPQQRNVITISTGNIADNVRIADSIVAKDQTRYNNIGSIVGVAKSVTTKTSMKLSASAEITCKSVTVETTPESLAAIRNGVDLYINFDVDTLQPTKGVTISDTYIPNGTATGSGSNKWDVNLASVKIYKIDANSVGYAEDDNELPAGDVSDNESEKNEQENDSTGVEDTGGQDDKKDEENDTDKGGEKEYTHNKSDNTLVIVICIIAAVLVIAAIVVIILVVRKKKKAKDLQSSFHGNEPTFFN